MNKYPKRVFIKGCNLFDDHTRTPSATFSASMYVMVNPWIDAHEPEYIRADLFEQLEKENEKINHENKAMRIYMGEKAYKALFNK